MSLTSCHCCGLIQTAQATGQSWCSRCRSRLAISAMAADNTPAAALAIVALAFYPLAMLAPFLRIERLGYSAESSLLGGTQALLTGGHLLVGLVVLLFSIVLPVIKLGTLLVLSASPRWLHSHHRAATYRIVEHLGRWGMLDVLLVAVLVAFVKLGDLVTFEVGPGLYLFIAFVTLNLFAGVTFNPHVLWEDTMSSSAVADGATSPEAAPSIKDDGVRREIPAALSTKPTRRYWWIAALFGVIAAAATATFLWPEPLHRVTLTFADGYGLKAGNAIRYRGIDIGKVEELKLGANGNEVVVTASLMNNAASLAREGTRWWVVRPEVSLTGAAGLETLLGDKFITLQPGDGPAQTAFVGLDRPPLVDLEYEGGLSIIVQANAGPRLEPGAGVFHRGVRVGGVRNVGLATDASAIEYDVYIRPQFAQLVTDDSVFWNTSGMTIGVGLKGLTVRLDSVAEIISGGMAMAVPAEGKPVSEGTRFILNESPEDEWLEWRPSVQKSESKPAAGPPLAQLTCNWTSSGLIARWTGEYSDSFLASMIGNRFLIPKPLLPTETLETPTIKWNGQTLTRDPNEDASAEAPLSSQWPIRELGVPEEITVLTERGPRTISAAQWIREGGEYRLPMRLTLPDGSLVAGSDGAILAYLKNHRLMPARAAEFESFVVAPTAD